MDFLFGRSRPKLIYYNKALLQVRGLSHNCEFTTFRFDPNLTDAVMFLSDPDVISEATKWLETTTDVTVNIIVGERQCDTIHAETTYNILLMQARYPNNRVRILNTLRDLVMVK
jgi:hypothetical protein